MSEVSLKAEVRLGSGKGVARKLRATGMVPGTVYGRETTAFGVAVNEHELRLLLAKAGANALISLDVDGKSHLTLARDVQRNPIRNEIIHVDFMEVSRDQEVVVDVPIHWVGKAEGEREGGIVEHVHNTLHVRAKAISVPDSIEVDVTLLTLDRPLTIGDVTVPDGVTVLMSVDEVVASCSLPKVVEEVVPELEAPAEPEVVGAPDAEAEEAPAE